MIKREAMTVPLEAKHAYKSCLLRSLVLPLVTAMLFTKFTFQCSLANDIVIRQGARIMNCKRETNIR
jgi:hypothetical protein